MSTNLKIISGYWSKFKNIKVRKPDNTLENIDNLIVEDKNGNKQGIWSRYKYINVWKSFSIPLVAFSTKIKPPVSGTSWMNARLSNDDIYFRDTNTYTKVRIPYKSFTRKANTSTDPVPGDVTYIFPIWYIPQDNKNRIYNACGGSVKLWPWTNSSRTIDGITYIPYTKVNLTGAGGPLINRTIASGLECGWSGHGRPYRGRLLYPLEFNVAEYGGYTKSFRYCGAGVTNYPDSTYRRDIISYEFTSDMDQYDAGATQLSITVDIKHPSYCWLSIDYIDYKGVQHVQTISSSTTITQVMPYSIVYATPVLLNVSSNYGQYYAGAIITNNSSGNYSDNKTIACGLLYSKVDLSHTYPNSFRIHNNCNIRVQRSNDGTKTYQFTATVASSDTYKWKLIKTISSDDHRVTIEPYSTVSSTTARPVDNSRYSLFRGENSTGTVLGWFMNTDAITSKVNVEPNGTIEDTFCPPSWNYADYRFKYDANGFITDIYFWTSWQRTFWYTFKLT